MLTADMDGTLMSMKKFPDVYHHLPKVGEMLDHLIKFPIGHHIQTLKNYLNGFSQHINIVNSKHIHTRLCNTWYAYDPTEDHVEYPTADTIEKILYYSDRWPHIPLFYTYHQIINHMDQLKMLGEVPGGPHSHGQLQYIKYIPATTNGTSNSILYAEDFTYESKRNCWYCRKFPGMVFLIVG